MAISEELTVFVRRNLRRRGNVVTLEFECVDNYSALQLHDKLRHSIAACGTVALKLGSFDEISEQEGL